MCSGFKLESFVVEAWSLRFCGDGGLVSSGTSPYFEYV